jgi:uncharacterized membrane protein
MTVAFETLRRTTRSGEATVENSAASLNTPIRTRVPSIDLLRGLVMVVMALDHTRDFFFVGRFNPHDVAEPALFLTRWITHFCAPAFIFLAGTSAFLYGVQGRTTGEVSRFLATRGLWLVLIELTVVRFAWTFSIHLNYFGVQVIFAIGASMIALAALVHLPRAAIAAIGLAMIFGHNMLDGIAAGQFGAFAPLWNLLHQPGLFDLAPGVSVRVLYPLVPWIGVIAAGYALGPVFLLDRAARVRRLLVLGGIAVAGFVLLRASNLYGDPAPWSVQNGTLATVLSFLDCEKYPPSLLYLGMTLGPLLLLLAAFERADGVVARWIATFGRVPFFYYVVHLYVLHVLAVLYSWATIGDLTGLLALGARPPGYGLGLPGIYAVWLAVVVLLYPLCRWFAGIKSRRTEWWWSYL